MSPRSIAPAIAAALLLLLPLGYAGSYLAIIQPGWEIQCCGHSSHDYLFVGYRIGGEWSQRFYWPLEQLDRRLRPGVWGHEDDQRLRPR
jgi:hypothetical protein